MVWLASSGAFFISRLAMLCQAERCSRFAGPRLRQRCGSPPGFASTSPPSGKPSGGILYDFEEPELYLDASEPERVHIAVLSLQRFFGLKRFVEKQIVEKFYTFAPAGERLTKGVQQGQRFHH
jgi:hypothetical protein